MGKSNKENIEALQIDRLHGYIRHEFKQFLDTRKPNSSIPLEDALLSGYAMFSLKDSSLLHFDNERTDRDLNLRKVYKIEKVPSDSGLRTILNPIKPAWFDNIFAGLYKRLKKAGIIKDYEYLKGHIICSIDGVHHFSSESICCDKCNLWYFQLLTKPYFEKME